MSKKYLIIDAHEDLAWNVLTFKRDYTLSAAETRRRELGTDIPAKNDDTLLGWPDYQEGNVALVFGTLFAAPIRRKEGEWDFVSYLTTAQARHWYRAQVDVYQRLADEHPDKFRLVRRKAELEAVLKPWYRQTTATHSDQPSALDEQYPKADPAAEPAGAPVGLVMLMEGAECVGRPEELEEWSGLGVRIIGPAWAGTRFCGGTREPGPLTREGRELLDVMAGLNLALDISHMDELAAREALERYSGVVIASHANAQTLVKATDTNRHLSDTVIDLLIERGACIGVVPYSAFLQAGWHRGDRRDGITLEHIAAQIDFICQRAGDAQHVGLGSDFDGGFGLQSTPQGIDTIADLQQVSVLLETRGYSPADIAAVMGENWIGILQKTLPD